MVVLAASIVTKAGKPIISRQFREIPKARIESLLTSFPKLIPPNSQHTSVETPDVRYVYQPLEDLYILLITNKASNILQDIETLHLFSRVVSDLCKSADEKEIQRRAFELLGAFDEIISLGYREKITLTQVQVVLEMESHEEKIQDIIARNKEQEAKEEIKRRTKQMDIQKREAQRRAAQGLPPLTNMDFGTTPNSGGYTAGYTSVSRYESSAPASRSESPAPQSKTSAKPVAFKGKGMKLGATKKSKEDEVLGSLGAHLEVPSSSRPVSSSHTSGGANKPSAVPSVEKEGVHIQIREQLAVRLARDSSIQSLELKGELHLQLAQASTPIKITLDDPVNTDAGDLLYKQHPKVAKFNQAPGERIIQHKTASETFPVGQPLGLLRWRLGGTARGKEEGYLPISITCWPTPAGADGAWDITLEYEVDKKEVELYDLVIEMPIPANADATVNSDEDYTLTGHSLVWTIPHVSSSSGTSTAQLEFNVTGVPGPEPNGFFPITVNFSAVGSLAEIGVRDVLNPDDRPVPFSQDRLVEVEEFTIG